MNHLTGHITSIESSGHLSMVGIDVDGDVFSSIVLETPATAAYLRQGSRVAVCFKETEVSLAKSFSGVISIRNRFKAVVEKVGPSAILTKVFLKYKNHSVVSVISTQSAQKLGLAAGQTVEWLVKTNEVALQPEN